MADQQAGTQAATQAGTQAQAVVTVYLATSRKRLACECGAFSATRGDYFMRGPSKVFHCLECDSDMELQQGIEIVGTSPDGSQMWATGWQVVKESGVTVADLED